MEEVRVEEVRLFDIPYSRLGLYFANFVGIGTHEFGWRGSIRGNMYTLKWVWSLGFMKLVSTSECNSRNMDPSKITRYTSLQKAEAIHDILNLVREILVSPLSCAFKISNYFGEESSGRRFHLYC